MLLLCMRPFAAFFMDMQMLGALWVVATMRFTFLARAFSSRV